MKIIAKGRVTKDGSTYFLSVPDDPEQPRTTLWRGWMLGRWAELYWNQWLTISLDETGEENGMDSVNQLAGVGNKKC